MLSRYFALAGAPVASEPVNAKAVWTGSGKTLEVFFNQSTGERQSVDTGELTDPNWALLVVGLIV
jgi:hypothetical protein